MNPYPVPPELLAAFWVTVTVVPWLVAIAFVAHVTREPKRELERVKEHYEQALKAKEETIKELRERLQFMRQKHAEEVKRYARISKALKELDAALKSGAVGLKCPKHSDAAVTLLADGTIVCSNGHRLWPPEEGEVSESEG